MIGWIFKRRRDGSLFRVTKIGPDTPYWRLQEIETGETMVVHADSLTYRSRWMPVGAARAPIDQT